ncbi:MAG: hypothetical protein K0R78_1087 [Pelosinus sp.]|jgi:hypothetical protein|nr:hypothetical protein [Pelosinus sp.]
MTRKMLVVLLGIVFLLGFTNTGMAKDYTENPIDKAFAIDRSEAMNTIEMNYVAEKYMSAWKAEMKNVATVITSKYKFAEDKAHIDAYVAAYEKVADAAGYVEWLNWSDTDEEPKARSFGTGAGSASLSAKANIYKQATLNLIQSYQGQMGEDSLKYNYVYSGNGAELEKIRVQQKCK